MTDGARTPSGISRDNLPQATLVASTRPVVDGTGAVRTDGLRVNGAAVRPVAATGNCMNQQTTGSGEYTACAAAPTNTISDGYFPASCAGSATGTTCGAVCTYGGTATVTCLASGQWDTSVTGSCSGKADMKVYTS